MKTLNDVQLEALLLGSRTIEEDGFGLKVACLSNGDFLKLYRRKRLLSSALWALPAQRFARNAERLRGLGITTPHIRELLLIPTQKINAVQYQPLPGDTLRNHWRSLDKSVRQYDVQQFGAFLGQLHQLGIYFRSLHLGNVLKLPVSGYGLIDLSDMNISGKPLSSWKRQRNLQHMLRYSEDRRWLTELHRDALLNGYRDRCGHAASALLDNALQRILSEGRG